MTKVNPENMKELYDTLWTTFFFDKVARVFENRSINEVLGRNGGVR